MANVHTFESLFVFTALFLAVGVIFYISAVNDEVSHRKKSDNKDEKFEYNYGWAFSFAGFCFISCMVVAVTNISLYLKRYPNLEDMVAIIPGLEKHSGLEIRSSSDDQLEHSAMTDPSTSCHNPTIILWFLPHLYTHQFYAKPKGSDSLFIAAFWLCSVLRPWCMSRWPCDSNFRGVRAWLFVFSKVYDD